MEAQPYKSCPRFVYVETETMRRDIIARDPKLKDLISDTMTEDTAIVVLEKLANQRVQTENRQERGIIYTNQDSFRSVMNRIWRFVDSYQRGSPIRKSVRTLITLLEEGKPQ